MSRKDRKFKGFFRQKLGDLQKKKKKVFAKIQGDFSSKISQVQTFEGGLFSYGGGLFSIFYRKSASKAQKTCDFASFTTQWGGLEPPPPPPPGYATEPTVMHCWGFLQFIKITSS